MPAPSLSPLSLPPPQRHTRAQHHVQWDADHHSFNFDPSKGPVQITWFKGGRTNVTYNCLDRWVAAGAGNQACLISEGNDLGHERCMTYHQVLCEVCRVVSTGIIKARTVPVGGLPLPPLLLSPVTVESKPGFGGGSSALRTLLITR